MDCRSKGELFEEIRRAYEFGVGTIKGVAQAGLAAADGARGDRQRELGLEKRETFVPRSCDWGDEAQADWCESWADMDGERGKLEVFSMRSMASGAACLRKRRLRFTTAAALLNELLEAKQQPRLSRVLGRWSRYELIAIDEVGYLPFSEWTKVIPNARLCKALLDRITDRAHIIETGEESYRFRGTLAKRKGRLSGGAVFADVILRFALRVPLRPTSARTKADDLQSMT